MQKKKKKGDWNWHVNWTSMGFLFNFVGMCYSNNSKASLSKWIDWKPPEWLKIHLSSYIPMKNISSVSQCQYLYVYLYLHLDLNQKRDWGMFQISPNHHGVPHIQICIHIHLEHYYAIFSYFSIKDQDPNGHSPHKTRRIALRQICARSVPPPRPRVWCTSPAGTGGCEAPSCAAPRGSLSRPGLPCRSSPRVPVPACPVRRERPCLSGPGKWPRCCSGFSGSSPGVRSWCRRRHRHAWTTRSGPGSGRACTWASWRISSVEGKSRPHSLGPRWGWGWMCPSPR